MPAAIRAHVRANHRLAGFVHDDAREDGLFQQSQRRARRRLALADLDRRRAAGPRRPDELSTYPAAFARTL